MKLQLLAQSSLVLGAVASKSWAGTSNYFLQGLSESDQQAYIEQLASDGVKVVRLWVNQQPGNNNCVKGSTSVTQVPDLEETIGQYNDQTLDVLDQTLVWLGDKGIKALISPHDANALNGANGNDIYGQTYGSGDFYEKQEAYDKYDARLTHILNYKGKYSGKTWKQWDDVIMAFDLQNEPFAPNTDECNGDAAAEWACGRAEKLRDLLGDSNIKVASGGFGGDISHGCTFLGGAMSCDALDIVSVHRYAGPQSDSPTQWSDSYPDWIDQANGKLVQLEEWGVDTTKYDATTEFPANAEDMNKVGLAFTYWQFLPHKTCDVEDSDPFGIYIDSGVPIKEQVQAANQADSLQDWSGIVD